MISKEYNIYKGIFWINDMDTRSLICFKIPCNINGDICLDTELELRLNSKSGNNYNHEKTWKELPSEISGGKAFNYYPRGRVEISKGKVKIFLNPNIIEDQIIDEIKKQFCLRLENGIEDVIIIPDYSAHYHCFLDKEK